VSTTRAFFFAMAGVQSIYDFVVKVLENLFGAPSPPPRFFSLEKYGMGGNKFGLHCCCCCKRVVFVGHCKLVAVGWVSNPSKVHARFFGIWTHSMHLERGCCGVTYSWQGGFRKSSSSIKGFLWFSWK
jgi:hypothetical protein